MVRKAADVMSSSTSYRLPSLHVQDLQIQIHNTLPILSRLVYPPIRPSLPVFTCFPDVRFQSVVPPLYPITRIATLCPRFIHLAGFPSTFPPPPRPHYHSRIRSSTPSRFVMTTSLAQMIQKPCRMTPSHSRPLVVSKLKIHPPLPVTVDRVLTWKIPRGIESVQRGDIVHATQPSEAHYRRYG